MEGNISSGNLMPGCSYGGFDLQGSIRVHNHAGLHSHPIHAGSVVRQLPIHENFPLSINIVPDCNQNITLSDYGKGEGVKSTSDDDEGGKSASDDQNRAKKALVWHRVKWTDQMVRLLITAVSYIGEEASAEYSGRRKSSNLHKKGKWKSVSKVMAERGHFVSPQQCEDKFNDLNKRYKRLNEILGKGTSCEVVENPALLDMMDHVPEKAKEEVRKILSSKHLHYEEMCSYHNGNRLHLPPDPDLQRSLRLALRTRDADHDDDADAELDEHEEECEEIQGGGPTKRIRPNDCYAGSLGFQPHNANADASQLGFGPTDDDLRDRRWMEQRFLQLEEQKLQIQAQMLELERERIKWQKFSKKKEFELESMRMENERMKLENERMALELKRKGMLAGDTGKALFEM
ncbi:unnamed protein product [Cuscuta campestris]|uniref:Myb/SANT-like DNA-binding domain-containing protein n=1 Tax=Cuscuta campestris TaxID=132261 RepID=A0A484MD57_9ASTE|nr:unnamed protein product [Cuscuta campestris]